MDRIILFMVGLCVGMLIMLSTAPLWHPEPEKKVMWIEKWGHGECLVLVNNGEEVAPVEPPFDCDKAQEEYPHAHYREL